jgi:hypothetical protein
MWESSYPLLVKRCQSTSTVQVMKTDMTCFSPILDRVEVEHGKENVCDKYKCECLSPKEDNSELGCGKEDEMRVEWGMARLIGVAVAMAELCAAIKHCSCLLAVL